MPETLNLYAGNKSTGEEATEEVLVEAMGRGRYRLLRSPGLVLGIAADDVFDVMPRGRFQVVQRGMNLGVQVYVPSQVPSVEARLPELMSVVGARLDGKSARQLVLTVPWRKSFEAIEAQLNRFVAEVDGVEWFYGNVYDPADGTTPIGWWNDIPPP